MLESNVSQHGVGSNIHYEFIDETKTAYYGDSDIGNETETERKNDENETETERENDDAGQPDMDNAAAETETDLLLKMLQTGNQILDEAATRFQLSDIEHSLTGMMRLGENSVPVDDASPGDLKNTGGEKISLIYDHLAPVVYASRETLEMIGRHFLHNPTTAAVFTLLGTFAFAMVNEGASFISYLTLFSLQYWVVEGERATRFLENITKEKWGAQGIFILNSTLMPVLTILLITIVMYSQSSYLALAAMTAIQHERSRAVWSIENMIAILALIGLVGTEHVYSSITAVILHTFIPRCPNTRAMQGEVFEMIAALGSQDIGAFLNYSVDITNLIISFIAIFASTITFSISMSQAPTTSAWAFRALLLCLTVCRGMVIAYRRETRATVEKALNFYSVITNKTQNADSDDEDIPLRVRTICKHK